MKDLAVARAMRNPQFQGLYRQYKLSEKPDWQPMSKYVPGMDTLQGVFDSTPEELFVRAEGLAMR